MKSWAKGVVALLLTFAAGCVDIIGYLSLYHTFTAHMTGLTVHLGQDVTSAKWWDGLVLTITLAAFLFGSVLGRVLVEIGFRRKQRSPAGGALLLESALLFAVATLGKSHSHVALISMLAAAMGVQTAALTRIGSLTVHTTFVTGMLNKLAQLLSFGLFLQYDEAQGRHQRSHLKPIVHRQTIFIFSIWVLYLVGAIVGTAVNSWRGAYALFLPAAIVVGIAIFDQIKPLGIEEELRDQRSVVKR